MISKEDFKILPCDIEDFKILRWDIEILSPDLEPISRSGYLEIQIQAN